MPLELRKPIQEAAPVLEAAPTVSRPTRRTATRAGYVPDIPRGGANTTNPIQAGSLSRKDLLTQLYLCYVNCPWVSASVDVIARTCTAGGVLVEPNSLTLDDPKIPPMPPEVKAVQQLLMTINPQDDCRQLFRTFITDLLIFGDAFAEVTYSAGKPCFLWHLSPPTMTVNADEHGTVTGFTQTMDTGRTVTFTQKEVIHVKLDSPRGGLYGVSPTEKGLMTIQAWLYTTALLTETMRRGDPSRLHVDWSVALTQNEIQRAQQQYAVRNIGAKNIGNLMETKGTTKVQEFGINRISDWLNSRTQLRDEIIAEYGVPPSKVSIIEAGNIGGGQGSSQDKMFRVNTCGPLQEILLEKFSFFLLNVCYKVTDWHLAFGEVDWRDDEVIEQIRDLRVRNGSWTLNRLRSDINEPPVTGGNIAIMVDRQNLVTWTDIAALSHANVKVLQMKAAGTAAAGTAQGAPSIPTAGTLSAPGVPKGRNAPRTAAKPSAQSARKARSTRTNTNIADLLEEVLAYHQAKDRVIKELP